MPSYPSSNTHRALGYRTLHYDIVTSTNDVAKEIAGNSPEANLVIIAKTQTYGRGRLGRQWVSPIGGIWLSILLRPETTLKETGKLTIIAASAVARAIQHTLGLQAEVKWPNDILLDGRKVCGILAETSTKGDASGYAIIGIGINANMDLDSFPTTFKDSATTLKHELGRETDSERLVAALLDNFVQRYNRLRKGEWDALRLEWKSLAKFLGKQVEVASFTEVIVGEALDIEEDCALLIRQENGLLKRIVAGDVKLRMAPTGG
jgi:BirA family biotin operon repressor/biotin-[acetyl-CoA-carboxylase] ligase